MCYKCKKSGHLSRDCRENSSEADQPHGLNANGADSEDLTSETKKSSSEMAKIAIDEDGIHEIGEEEKMKLNDLDYLTGNPLPSDILLYAVPVCGPYNALQTYKYRVKITPGTAKKGKGIIFSKSNIENLSELCYKFLMQTFPYISSSRTEVRNLG